MKTSLLNPGAPSWFQAVKTLFFLLVLVWLSVLSGCKKEEEVKPAIPTKETKPIVTNEQLIHKIPKMPILLDGKPEAPEAVQQFNGKPLYYVLDKKAFEEGVLRVFTTEEKAKAYRQEVEATFKLLAPQASARVQGEQVDLFEESNYRGNRWVFHLGSTDIRDFNHVYPTLWWDHNINDRITSICSYLPYNWTILYDLPYYGGSQFWVYPYECIANLGMYGRNDRASSMAYAPYR